jgi:hypothetical protein
MGNWNKQKCHVTYAWNLQFLRNVIYKKLYQSFSGVADFCYLGFWKLRWNEQYTHVIRDLRRKER